MRSTVLIVVSTLVLITLLFIQIDWIIKSAELKEEQFNQRTTLALSRTVEDLCTDEAVCRAFRICLMDSKSGECKLQIGMNERNKLDSLLRYYFKFYAINLKYTYEFVKPDTASAKAGPRKKFYYQSLHHLTNGKNIELKLFFPEKKEFIFAEIGSMFIISVALILVIITFFCLTLASLKKERKAYKENKDFINTMTHELKTPITNIRLASSFLAGNYSADPDTDRSYIQIIQDENKKLNQLVEKTLSLSILEKEFMETKQEVDIHEVIRQSIANMCIQVQEKGTQLTTEFGAKEFVVKGDRTHLIGAFCNLLDNANKYSPSVPKISICTKNSENTIVITIHDNGYGIDKENQNKIFEDFFRISSTTRPRVKGYGLGLAYVKKVINLHKGRINLTSELHKGSCFEIILPN